MLDQFCLNMEQLQAKREYLQSTWIIFRNKGKTFFFTKLGGSREEADPVQ